MTTLGTSNIIVFTTARLVRKTAPRVRATRPVLCTHWHVSPETGRLECRWVSEEAAPLPYSLAA